MITEIWEILALAARALALCARKQAPRKRIYLQMRDNSWADSVEDIRAGRNGFLRLRKVRSQYRRER